MDTALAEIAIPRCARNDGKNLLFIFGHFFATSNMERFTLLVGTVLILS
jgi:hypothetical protein